LNGNGNGHVSVADTSEHSADYYDFDRNKPVVKTCDKDNTSEECKKSWNSFWDNSQYTDEEIDAMCHSAEVKDKVKKWVLPVDDDYNITFPEDLLEQTGWKEGDTLQWIDQGDGSFIMKKVKDESVHENDWNKDYEV